jgi:hypothetical protein
MEVANMSINKYANIIARLHENKKDKVEKDFFSRKQWEKIWKLQSCQTNRRIRDLIESGMMETKKFNIQTTSRGLYPTPHYKIIKCTN